MLIYFFAYCDSLFWLTFRRCSCKLGRLKQFSVLLIYSSPFHLMYKSLTIYVSNFTDPKADCEGNFFLLQGLLLLTRCSCEASSTDFLKCSIIYGFRVLLQNASSFTWCTLYFLEVGYPLSGNDAIIFTVKLNRSEASSIVSRFSLFFCFCFNLMYKPI